jgi:hypothetical protein
MNWRRVGIVALAPDVVRNRPAESHVDFSISDAEVSKRSGIARTPALGGMQSTMNDN